MESLIRYYMKVEKYGDDPEIERLKKQGRLLEIDIKRLRKQREQAMAKQRMTEQAAGDGQAMEALGKGKAAMNEGFGEEGAAAVLEQVGKQIGGGGAG